MIIIVTIILSAINVLASTVEIPKKEFSDPNIIAELKLLMTNGATQNYIIYRSPFIEEDLQLESSIRFVHEFQIDIKEIFSINGVALKDTIYWEYAGSIDRIKKSTSEDEYSRGKHLDMIEKNPNAPKISAPKKEAPIIAYVQVDGVPLVTDVDAFIVSGRTMVPFRAIGEALNAEVGFNFINDNLRVVWAIRYYTKIDLNIGDYRIFKDGNYIFMDQPPFIKDGRTFVPVRYIAELFDCKVEWDDSTSTAKISTKK